MSLNPYRKSSSTPKLTWIPVWCNGLIYLLRRKISHSLAFFWMVMVMVMVLLHASCQNGALQIQVQTANAVAHAANSAIPMLVDRYRQEGLKAIQVVKIAGGTADEARAAVAVVKAKWEPVWQAWESLRVAQDTWATVLEAGGDTATALVSLQTAYCGLQKVWPEDIPVVPLSLLRCDPL